MKALFIKKLQTQFHRNRSRSKEITTFLVKRWKLQNFRNFCFQDPQFSTFSTFYSDSESSRLKKSNDVCLIKIGLSVFEIFRGPNPPTTTYRSPERPPEIGLIVWRAMVKSHCLQWPLEYIKIQLQIPWIGKSWCLSVNCPPPPSEQIGSVTLATEPRRYGARTKLVSPPENRAEHGPSATPLFPPEVTHRPHNANLIIDKPSVRNSQLAKLELARYSITGCEPGQYNLLTDWGRPQPWTGWEYAVWYWSSNGTARRQNRTLASFGRRPNARRLFR